VPHTQRNDSDEQAVFIERFAPIREYLLRTRFEQKVLDSPVSIRKLLKTHQLLIPLNEFDKNFIFCQISVDFVAISILLTNQQTGLR
jgi:hypothetical protein